MPEYHQFLLKRFLASPHYVRQSPFAGSNREVRGLILRALLDEPILSFEELAQAVGLDTARIQMALEQLVAEGFVVREGERLRLAARV